MFNTQAVVTIHLRNEIRRDELGLSTMIIGDMKFNLVKAVYKQISGKNIKQIVTAHYEVDREEVLGLPLVVSDKLKCTIELNYHECVISASVSVDLGLFELIFPLDYSIQRKPTLKELVGDRYIEVTDQC